MVWRYGDLSQELSWSIVTSRWKRTKQCPHGFSKRHVRLNKLLERFGTHCWTADNMKFAATWF